MRRLFLVAILLGASACKDPPPACIAVETACSPLYPPTTFANVYSMTIVRQCGSDKGSCHSASGESILSLATEQEAYDNLLANHVTPGDPGCSELVVRTSSPGADYQMPKGGPLIESEQCALRKWVESGAPR